MTISVLRAGRLAFGAMVAATLWGGMQAALADDGVSLICCPVDYSENLRLTDRLGELDETL